MTTLREAAQQALEAMEYSGMDVGKFNRINAACAALRAALAATREHITDGTPCWCQPELDYVDPDTGTMVWIHKEPQ